MAIDFPNPPLTIGQQYPYNGTTWQWNGYSWIVVGTYPPIGGYVVTYNGLTGAVTGVTVGGTNVFTALNTFNAGISASGATFSAPITSTRMARHTSAVISAEQTADFSPTAAEDGTVFYVNYGGKGSLTITLEGLPVGWRAKFFNIGGGTVFFTSTTGGVWGEGVTNGLQGWLMEAICFSAGNYIVG